jgi:hypothetical protein
MKQLLILSLALILPLGRPAQAELTPRQFGQAGDWAEKHGYVYQGIKEVQGLGCYYFVGSMKPSTSWKAPKKAVAIAPVESNTVAEAIAALLASSYNYVHGYARGATAIGTVLGPYLNPDAQSESKKTDL